MGLQNQPDGETRPVFFMAAAGEVRRRHFQRMSALQSPLTFKVLVLHRFHGLAMMALACLFSRLTYCLMPFTSAPVLRLFSESAEFARC